MAPPLSEAVSPCVKSGVWSGDICPFVHPAVEGHSPRKVGVTRTTVGRLTDKEGKGGIQGARGGVTPLQHTPLALVPPPLLVRLRARACLGG